MQTNNEAITGKFDPANLIGDEFQRYIDFLKKLAPTDAMSDALFEFDVYEAKPVYETQKNGHFGVLRKFVGIALLNPNPIKTVKIMARDAIRHNLQIESGQSHGTGGTYYVLKN